MLRADSFGVEDVDQPTDPENCTGPFDRIRVRAAALNHRDQFIREGKYAKIQLPAILGSDLCGTSYDGLRVVVDPSLNWGDSELGQGRGYHILGMPTQGGFAEEVVVPLSNVYAAPEHLSDVEAAALPLAGVTAWRAVMVQGACSEADTVLVTGIGGGVSTMAMLFACATGAKVIVSSRSTDKLQRAQEIASERGYSVDTIHLDDLKTFSTEMKAKAPSLVIDSIGNATFNTLLDGAAVGARIVVYGASTGSVESMNIHRVFWKQLKIIGSTMGSAHDFRHMLDFVNKHKITPVVDSIFPLEEGPAAFDRMNKAEQLGKIVLDVHQQR